MQSVLDQALAGVETANFEFPLITKYVYRIKVLLNATTRRNEHSNVIGLVGIRQDITACLTQEKEYSKLIDNANAHIFGVDTQGCVIHYVPVKFLGIPLKRSWGRIWWENS